MGSSSAAYSSVRRSLQSNSFIYDSAHEHHTPRPNVSKRSQDLLLLLQILSFHKARHLSIPLLAGFHRGTALGSGASFNVKEFPLPTDGALHHLRIRDPTEDDQKAASIEDITNERWSTDTKGAFKSSSSTTYSELIRELQILCHPSLRGFVVGLAGLAWVARPTVRGESAPEEQPMIVVEMAQRGSLQGLMRSEDYSSIKASLKAKFWICKRVLQCIAALHLRGVVHADIKTSNVLLYSTEDIYSEILKIKLSDFGNSVLYTHNEPNMDTNSIHGTPLYQAPELDRGGTKPASIEVPTATDIWSWGMLLWEVICDGDAYKDQAGNQILPEKMQELRNNGEVGPLAYNVCLSHIKRSHVNEHGNIRRQALDALQEALQVDPRARPSASNLLSRLEGLQVVDQDATSDVVPTVTEIPQFNIIDLYYDLMPFSSVPIQVYKALEEFSTGEGTSCSHIKLQLGLCHVSGFGTEVDHLKGLSMIQQAAVDGSRHARAITARFYRALGAQVPSSLTKTLFSWLSESANSGSRIAAQDLEILFPEKSSQKRRLPKLPSGGWTRRLLDLCDELEKGEETQILPQDVSVGPNGDSMLHWCVFLLPEFGTRIATSLVNHGCSTTSVTIVKCAFSEDTDMAPYSNDMPARTTPIDWAIIEDNMEMLKVLLQVKKNEDENAIESPAFIPATCAAHYQRLECLQYILELGYDASGPDDNGRHPMFHATYPNIFAKILRFGKPPNTESRELQQPENCTCAPVHQMESDIIKLLQTHGASLAACPQDDLNPLHLAVATKGSPVLETLLKTEDLRGYVDQNAKGEWSPLCYAVSLGNDRAIDMLLEHGADINQLSSLRGFNALHVCAIFTRPNSIEIASRLIDRSPRLVNSRSKSGYTALHFAAVTGNVSLMNRLAAKGAHLMAASNKVTALGLALAYWSELGVEEMCRIHMKMKVPCVPAFDSKNRPGHWSQAVGPLEMMLARRAKTPLARVRDIPSNSRWGCFDPPLSGPSENILRTLLQYPFPKNPFEELKIWYYQTTEQYDFRDILKRRWYMTVVHVCSFLAYFAWGLLRIVLFEVEELQEALVDAINLGDIKLMEILLDACSSRKAFERTRSLIYICHWYTTPSIPEDEDPYTMVLKLLMDRQCQRFSQVRHHRTHGALRFFWKPLYGLYLDIEQTEWTRYNDYKFRKLTRSATLEYRLVTILPPIRFPTWQIVPFACLWVILGRVFYHQSGYVHNVDESMPAPNWVWTICLVIVLHLCCFWVIVFRVASVYSDAFLVKTYGVLRLILQMVIIAAIFGCGWFAQYFLDPRNNHMMPCYWLEAEAKKEISNQLNSTSASKETGPPPPFQEPLNGFCGECESMRTWVLFITLIPSGVFFILFQVPRTLADCFKWIHSLQ